MLFCVADMIYIKLPLNHCQHAVGIATPTGHKSKAKSIFTPPPIRTPDRKGKQDSRQACPAGQQIIFRKTILMTPNWGPPHGGNATDTAATATIPIGAPEKLSIRTGLCNTLHSYSITTVNQPPSTTHTPPPRRRQQQPCPLKQVPNETQNRAGIAVCTVNQRGTHTERGRWLRYAPCIAANSHRYQPSRYS